MLKFFGFIFSGEMKASMNVSDIVEYTIDVGPLVNSSDMDNNGDLVA